MVATLRGETQTARRQSSSWHPRREAYCRRNAKGEQGLSGIISHTQEQTIGRWWIFAAQELLTEVLNLSGFDTDANGDVLPVAEDCNLDGQPHAISVSQRLDQPIGATDPHINGASVVLQREGGTPTLPS